MSYNKHFPQKNASVMEQTRADQVQASDGGYVFQADAWERLNRFLVIGAIGGSYYASERELSRDNILNVVLPIVQSDGPKVVETVVQISEEGRAIKNDEALFVLALCASQGDETTRQLALSVLPRVARIATHLFQFINYVTEYRGWGRQLRRGVANWYTSKDAGQLAYQMLKYRNREGFTHADVLNLAHPRPVNDQQEVLFLRALADQDENMTGRYMDLRSRTDMPDLVVGFEHAQQVETTAEIIDLIEEFRLTREMIPNQFLKTPEVWEAMLDVGMPMTAMVRNLGNMSKYGLLQPLSDSESIVVGALGDEHAIKKSRLHPVQLLSALLVYKAGHGFRGTSTWPVNAKIVDALDEAFYLSFQNVEPTGKRIMLALDVSASMSSPYIQKVPMLTPEVGTAAMALVTANVEPSYYSVAFSSGLVDFPLSSRQRLDDVLAAMDRLPFDWTRVAAPIEYATQNHLEVDAFVVYTDNETNSGPHPYQALRAYRQKSGIPAKLVVVGMVSNGFSVADPDDPGMLDVVGFDTATPRVISEFIRS